MPLDIKQVIEVNELLERQRIAYRQSRGGSSATGYALADIGWEDLHFIQGRLEEIVPNLASVSKTEWACHLPEKTIHDLLRE